MCTHGSDTTTQDGARGCCEPETQAAAGEHGADDWLGEADPLEARLPDEVRAALGRFLGKESVDTLGEWTGEVRQLTGGGSIDVDQLCHAEGETPHWGEVGGERYHFQCFYDAVILAAIEDRPVDIHTVTPGGTVVEARAVGSEELSVTPNGAVFSFGIATDAHEESGDEPTLEDGYAAICPYVKAFPDREAYEGWADDVPAATVAFPLAGATEVANALVS
jgi:hypothetical protein